MEEILQGWRSAHRLLLRCDNSATLLSVRRDRRALTMWPVPLNPRSLHAAAAGTHKLWRATAATIGQDASFAAHHANASFTLVVGLSLSRTNSRTCSPIVRWVARFSAPEFRPPKPMLCRTASNSGSPAPPLVPAVCGASSPAPDVGSSSSSESSVEESYSSAVLARRRPSRALFVPGYLGT